MTLIQGHGRFCRKQISKDPLGSLSLPESSHDEAPIDPPAIGFFKSSITKYTKKDLQKIPKMVLEAQTPSFVGSREKPLKSKSPDVYCDKFYIKYYNFC